MRQTARSQPAVLRTAVAVTGACAALWFNPVFSSAQAQDPERRVEVLPRQPGGIDMSRFPELQSVFVSSSRRAVIGLTMAARGQSDTAGVLVESVTPGGPADKAGIKQGTRISAINGISLRVSGADAADSELLGVAQRRMQRELARATPGSEVELRVNTGGSAQTIKLKTVSAAELSASTMPANRAVTVRGGSANRASLGVSVAATGSVRDTSGLFISSVSSGGPAEKAGVFEGDRVAAINGVDVRVPREDAEDPQAAGARVNRFLRELAKAAPGDKVTLRVFGNGRYRDVQITTGNSADMNNSLFRFNGGDGPAVMNIPRLLRVPGTVRVLPPTVLRRGIAVQ